jgi:hypothetical protein
VRGKDTGVPDGVDARRRNGRGEAHPQREAVHVDGLGAIRERALEFEAHETVLQAPDAPRGNTMQLGQKPRP